MPPAVMERLLAVAAGTVCAMAEALPESSKKQNQPISGLMLANRSNQGRIVQQRMQRNGFSIDGTAGALSFTCPGRRLSCYGLLLWRRIRGSGQLLGGIGGLCL